MWESCEAHFPCQHKKTAVYKNNNCTFLLGDIDYFNQIVLLHLYTTLFCNQLPPSRQWKKLWFFKTLATRSKEVWVCVRACVCGRESERENLQNAYSIHVWTTNLKQLSVRSDSRRRRSDMQKNSCAWPSKALLSSTYLSSSSQAPTTKPTMRLALQCVMSVM